MTHEEALRAWQKGGPLGTWDGPRTKFDDDVTSLEAQEQEDEAEIEKSNFVGRSNLKQGDMHF